MQYLCNRISVGLPFGIFESVGTELIFSKPIRNPTDFGSESKLMLSFRSDGHFIFSQKCFRRRQIDGFPMDFRSDPVILNMRAYRFFKFDN